MMMVEVAATVAAMVVNMMITIRQVMTTLTMMAMMMTITMAIEDKANHCHHCHNCHCDCHQHHHQTTLPQSS